jgi:TolA-binding protein
MRIIFILFLGFLVGCETLMTRESIRETEKRDMNDRVMVLQKTNADTHNRFADIDADLRQLNGRIEVLENRLGQSTQEKEKLKKSSDEQIADLQKKTTILQEEIAKLTDVVAALSSQVANQANRPSEPQDKSSTFDVAQDFFEKKDFKKAILNFQKFRDNNPKDKRVPEAVYKIAVSFQELGMKDESIPFFEEVISKYPNSSEAKKAKVRLKKVK